MINIVNSAIAVIIVTVILSFIVCYCLSMQYQLKYGAITNASCSKILHRFSLLYLNYSKICRNFA